MQPMEWEIVYYSEEVQHAIVELPAGMQARYIHLTQHEGGPKKCSRMRPW